MNPPTAMSAVTQAPVGEKSRRMGDVYHHRTCRSAPVQSIRSVFAKVSTAVAYGGRRSDRGTDRGRNINGEGLEETLAAKERNEVRHSTGVEITGAFEMFHDDLGDGSRAVHLLGELRLPHLELKVDHAARVGDHRVVVAPPEPEESDLDIGDQLRAKQAQIQTFAEGFPHVDGVGRGSPPGRWEREIGSRLVRGVQALPEDHGHGDASVLRAPHRRAPSFRVPRIAVVRARRRSRRLREASHDAALERHQAADRDRVPRQTMQKGRYRRVDVGCDRPFLREARMIVMAVT